MGYVFSEILPWIVGALVLGFLLGWLFWRCWLWLRRRDSAQGEGVRLTGQIGDLEAKNRKLQTEVDSLRGQVADCASVQAEAASLRARVAEFEARPAAAVGAPLGGSAGPLASPAVGSAAVPGKTSGAKAPAAKSAAAKAAAPETAASKSRATKPAVPKAPAPAKVLDLAAAASILGSKIKLDDLTVVEGIGPQIAGLLKNAGITTWSELAKAKVPALSEILDQAGPRFRMHDAGTWPQQARLLAKGAWAEFKTLTDSLKGGRR